MDADRGALIKPTPIKPKRLIARVSHTLYSSEVREDIELQFIREFAVGGVVLTSGSISSDDRCERIRVQIMKAGKHNQPFHDFGMSYGEAFRLAYGKPVELRRAPRDTHGRPATHLIEDSGDDDDD